MDMITKAIRLRKERKMATIKRRAWRTSKGERKEAWRVRYVDQYGETRTRQFAKRQMTWFKRQLPIDWQNADSIDVNKLV